MFRFVKTSKSLINLINAENCIKRYAGHSKWQNIKHTKGLKDTQRGQLFTRLSKKMVVAIQMHGSADPAKNLQLSQVIEQAKNACMPVATIQNVLKSTKKEKSNAKECALEIKGPGKCLMMCQVFTDNLRSCKMTIATILKKNHAAYVEGVKNVFDHTGVIHVKIPEGSQDNVLEKATDDAILAGAEDVTIEDDVLRFTCSPEMVANVSKILEKDCKYEIINSGTEYIPKQTMSLSEKDLELVEILTEKLYQNPDVMDVYDNIVYDE